MIENIEKLINETISLIAKTDSNFERSDLVIQLEMLVKCRNNLFYTIPTQLNSDNVIVSGGATCG